MALPRSTPTVRFYRRDGCHLCDEGRAALQLALEDRAAAGRTPCRVEEVDLATDPAGMRRYLETIPVLVIENVELPLAISGPRIRRFLDQELDRGLA
jgi:Glutaredoxin-like domain (DUF836)